MSKGEGLYVCTQESNNSKYQTNRVQLQAKFGNKTNDPPRTFL